MSKRFPVGKLPTEVLGRLLERYRLEDERVVLGSRIGEDAAAIDMGDRLLIAKTDPITFATDRIGWYAVNINANDLATMGAIPKWFLVSLLLPEKKTDQALVGGIFDDIYGACLELGISLVGGHTEITYGLERPIVVGQMLGEVEKDKLVTTAGAQVGDDILLTKGIAIEATSLIAREKERYLRKKGYSESFISKAKAFLSEPGISVLREARVAVSTAPIHAMHDPTEGGVATGLRELAQAASVGLLIEAEAIRILPECQRLCLEFGLDPLGVVASGALIIALSSKYRSKVIGSLAKGGIGCQRIGEVRPKEEGLHMLRGGRKMDFPVFSEDEIAKIF